MFWMWVCILNWAILVVGLGLYIKLSFNYGKLSSDLMEFILIYHVLDFINLTYILTINLEILDWGL